MRQVLIVGAGFAGAVYARTLAEAGIPVRVIDRRDHIGGNCFDSVGAAGIRIHRYGPHLFHTNMMEVVDWLSQFTEWTPYEHRVVAQLDDGRLLPMPINIDTINGVFGTRMTEIEEVRQFLAGQAVAMPAIRTAEDYLYSSLGTFLTDKFFRPYTQKMWKMDLSEMDAAVVRRVQVRAGTDDRYFPNDTFQAMPKEGYTALFANIFRHPLIQVELETEFSPDMLDGDTMCFNSMPIDVFFGHRLGELPYRSIRFHTTEEPLAGASSHVTINYTDTGPFTRETWWHNIPCHVVRQTGRVVRTVEEPCDYRDNAMERYYPVKTHDGRFDTIYQGYKALAASLDDIQFIGRCGTYQYLDMHQVINQSLQGVRSWLAGNRLARTG